MTRTSWPKLLLLCAAILPFCGSLNSGFHFDDYAIFQDAAIRAPNGWLTVWNLGQTRPLTYLTFWLNYRLGGENPIGYHAVNLLLHAAAVLVLYDLFSSAGDLIAGEPGVLGSPDFRRSPDPS